ncbi:MAG: hypothetical protein WC780_15395 [Lentimicrobiaceae bacterium]|jgi:hypothetical protein
MKLELYIASIYTLLIVMPVTVAGQGVIVSSGIYMKMTGGTMVLHNSNWVNNGNYTDQNGTIIINGNTHVSGSSLNTFGDVTVITGSMLSINSQNFVTINGLLTNNAGTTGFVLQSDSTGTASLLHNTDNVPATVQRYISGDAEAWHFLSSPVAAQGISGTWLPSGTYGNGTGYDLYLWNESNNCWIYKLNLASTINWNTVHPGSDFTPGRGYLYSVQATNPTKEFAGNLNNGSLTYPLTFNSADAVLKGFNLVGNPYPSSIDWEAASGWTRDGLVNSGGGYDIWIWNQAANNYGVFNSATGIGTNSITRYIAPMQGFFVKASVAGNLQMDNDVRVHDGSGWFKNADLNPARISLVVQSESDKSFDEALLLFGYSANEPGAVKLFSHVLTAPSLYLSSGNEKYSVQYLTDTVDNPTVPVMFKPGKDGNYTLRCNLDNDIFNSVTLEDRQMHYRQDLKSVKMYCFLAAKTDDANRFVLHFGTENNSSGNELPARIYSDGNQLIIDLKLVRKKTMVMVYDVLGRKLLQQELPGETLHNLGLNVPRQILVVFLKNADGSFSRKIVWAGN